MNKNNGFTLIELMVTIAIIGILSAIAFPSYTSYIQRGNRANARVVLLEAAQFMERYRSVNFVYPDGATAGQTLPASLAVSPRDGDKRYDVAIDTTNATATTSFTIVATPSGWADALCGNLSITNLGIKGQTSGDAANCWNK